ncbi:transposase, mutator family [mine drainage metagenome]|uniref:Transposase, mutator family n=1 Tax=mine drainage metagenome TaxID=410659 RepID=A0A1J5PH61_9ZZZZ
MVADLRLIYASATVDEADARLTELEEKWDAAFPPIAQSWRRNWYRIIPFFDYSPEIRRIICTTNAIESVSMSLRKITKNRGSFSGDKALLKLFYLALMNISQKWAMPLQNWKAALNRFTIQFEDPMPNR